jgi:hypothetical protein
MRDSIVPVGCYTGLDMKYLYEANRDFKATGEWCHESEQEIQQHLDYVFARKSILRSQQGFKRATALTLVSLGLLLLGFTIWVFLGLATLPYPQPLIGIIEEIGVFGFLFALPGIMGMRAGIRMHTQSLESYVAATRQDVYKGLTTARPIIGKVTAVDILTPNTRRIQFLFFYRAYKASRYEKGSYLTASHSALSTGDEVVVLIDGHSYIAVLL